MYLPSEGFDGSYPGRKRTTSSLVGNPITNWDLKTEPCQQHYVTVSKEVFNVPEFKNIYKARANRSSIACAAALRINERVTKDDTTGCTGISRYTSPSSGIVFVISYGSAFLWKLVSWNPTRSRMAGGTIAFTKYKLEDTVSNGNRPMERSSLSHR